MSSGIVGYLYFYLIKLPHRFDIFTGLNV